MTMTDEKEIPAGAGAPDFGEIQITGEAAPHRPAARSAASASKPPKAAAPPEKKSNRQNKAPRSGGRGRLCLVLLLLPPALLLLWLAGAFYLLPLYVQGPMAEQLSRQLGRPVTVGQVSLAPFKLLLRLNEITVGPAASRPDEPELARIASAEARIRPAGLLKGRLMLEDVRVDRLRASLIRRSDGSFNALPPGGFFSGLSLLPSWLHLRDLRLHRSTVHFLDQPSGKKHLVEHIEFVLPPAGQGLDPSLSAAVNSSPLQLIGQRQEADGGPETRLTLKLDNLDPQQYLGLFPELAKSLSLSAARADAVLEISLREAGAGLNATCSVTFSNLLAQSADYEERPAQAFRLTSPTAHVIVQAVPLQRQYAVEELLLEEPQLDLPPSMAGLLDGAALAAKAAALLNPAETGLAVGRLTLNRGQVRSGGQEWADVQLELSGFENLKAAAQGKNSGPARLLISASSGKSAFSFTGAADPAFSLNGSLNLQNMRADLLRPFLSTDEGLRFTKGGADISGELRLEQRADGSPSLTITGGAVTLRDFMLQQKKTALLNAKSLRAADCVLDGSARSVSCGTTALDEADFADTGLFLPGGAKDSKRGRLHVSSSTLELKNSSARLLFGPVMLPLSSLNLSVQADGSLKLTGAAGKQGGIEINGAAAKGKDGAVALSGKLSLKNVSADLLHPYLTQGGELRFKQGGADVSGSFSLNGASLSLVGSSVTLRNFALQRGEAALLSGKAASGLDCALDSAARSMSCGKITLDGADFADSGFFLRPADRLRLSVKTLELKDSSAELPLGTAMLPLSSLKMSLSGLTQKQPGQISLEAASSGGRLEISGTAVKEDAGIALSGTLALRNAGPEILQPYFGDGIVFSKGGADLSGTFKTSGSALHLSGGAVTLRDFSLQRGGAALVSGRTAHGSDCALDGAAKSMSCGKIALDGADFADSGFFLRPAGRLRLSANALELKDSAVKLPFGAAMLPLSSLKMSLGGLPGPVSLEAAVGSGRLELSGEAARSEAGLALSGQLSLKGAGAEILQPYLGEGISPAKGGADISGGFRLSQAEGGSVLNLSNGAVTLRDFSLQRGGAALVSGRTAHGADCSLDGAAKSMSCGKITVDGADFADSGFFLRPAGRLRLSANALELKDSAVKLALGAATLPLSGLKMSLGGLPGPVSLEAAADSGRLAVSGEAEKTESGLSLGGSVMLRNADASLLNPFLGDELRFSRGKAELSGAGRLSAGADGGAALHLASGAVTMLDFSIERGGAALVSGKAANGADCVLDGAARSMSCGRIALEGADFAAEAPGFFFRSGGGLRLAADAVEISGSSGLLPVGHAMLPLSGLKMSLNGLRGPQPPQNNFRFAADAGQGSLKAEGQLRRDGSGAAELTAERLDIRLFSKAFASLFRDSLSLKQGSLSAKGEFRLPESRFSGSLSVDSFAAETGRGDSLSWRRAAADKAALSLSPFAAAAARLDVEEPQLRLAAAADGLPGAFLGLFAFLPQTALEQCVISGGGLRLGGGIFSGVQGSIGPVRQGAAALFSFSGKMDGSDFAASGSAGREGAALDKLTVERLPLEKTGQLLAKELGLDSSRGQVTRSVSADGDRLDFSGFVPLSKSDHAFTLALLTGKDGGFSLPLHGLPVAAGEETLAKAAADALRKLRLQHAVSPWTVLDKLVSGLSKAQNIDFLPGDKVPDFMDGLDGVREISALRPHLGWTVKGCYDREADRKTLLAQVQKIGAQKTEEENVRRKQELDRLVAQETLRQETLNKAGLPIIKDLLPEIKAREDLQPLPAPQAELPESLLPELARVRAEVVRGYLLSKLGVPAERVKIEESAACGIKAELMPAPFW